MTRRPVLLVTAVVLAVAAVVLLLAGVDVRETTGGLLVAPIRQLHLVGGYLVAGTAAGVAAVLTALAAFPAGRRGAADEEPPTESVDGSPPSGEPDPAAVSLTPGAERSS